MKIHEINIYLKLEKGAINESAIRSILNSNHFKGLLNTGIILRTPRGRGAIYQIQNKKEFHLFFNNYYNKEIESQESNRIINAVKYKNSKIRSKGEQIVFVRGFTPIVINNQNIDLGFYTQQFGVFSTQLEHLKTQKICYIENLKCFLIAETLLGTDHVFIHPYGRPSIQLIQKLEVEHFLFCPDYDYTGLNDYMRCKKIKPLTKLYLTENYIDFIQKNAKVSIKSGQKIPKEVELSDNNEVITIFNLLQ